MSLFLPYGMNSSLKSRASPFAALINNPDGAKHFGKLQRIAEKAELQPREKAQTVGKMLMSGALRAGAGPNGNLPLQKRAQDRRRYPIKHDDPQKALLNQQVGTALANLRGHAGHPATPWLVKGLGTSGVGRNVRMLKQANDRNMPPVYNRDLPGDQSPVALNEDAIEVLNSLPDARVRNSAITAIMTRPPASVNDKYRWLQSIVALAEQIDEMCKEMGLDPTALLDLLDRKVDFYDPGSQSEPATNPPLTSNVGPTVEDPSDWRGRAQPPAKDDDPGPFEGADRTDLNPDFKEEKLAKFYDYTKRGVDVRKTNTGNGLRSAADVQLEQYGLTVARSELPADLRDHVLALHKARKRTSKKKWAELMRHPLFQQAINAINGRKDLSRSMKGAVYALIT